MQCCATPPPCRAVNGLTKSALEAIRASMALEELLLEECRDSEAAPDPWGTMERLSPLLYTWAQVGVVGGGLCADEARACPDSGRGIRGDLLGGWGGEQAPQRRLLCASPAHGAPAHVTWLVLSCRVQGQISMLGGWMDRILSAEDWTRVSKQRAHGSR